MPCSTGRSAPRRHRTLALLASPGGERHRVLVSSTCSSSSPSRSWRVPLEERRRRLEALVGPSSAVLVSPQFDDGQALLAAARQQELEGVVAKQRESRYQPGRRAPDWQKLKLRQTQDVIIAGYTKGQGRAYGVRRARGRGTGGGWAALGRKRRNGLLRSGDRASPRPPPATRAPGFPVCSRCRGCPVCGSRTSPGSSPVLVAEVEFAEWTHEAAARALVSPAP